MTDELEAIEQMADRQTRIVSLTVTEKGYCRDPSTGKLASNHPEIVADLDTPRSSQTAVGCIVEALRRRRERGLGWFTVLSCDNLPSNGAAIRQVVVEYSGLLDDAFSKWIQRNMAFPSSIGERICLATTPADRDAAADALGLRGQGLVVTEPFSQWVIGDQFCNGRPRWEDAGAEIVTDVDFHETAKLRLLNGSHSALAYIGCLAGYEFVHEVVGDHSPKPAYFAYQNLCSVMDSSYRKDEPEYQFTVKNPGSFVGIGEYEDAFPSVPLLAAFRSNDSALLAYWLPWIPQETIAEYYFLSYPAHSEYPTTLVKQADAKHLNLGSPEECNQRVIHQSIRPGIVDTCQVVLGFTQLAPGSVWNTMPAQTHRRRSEIYMYFDLDEASNVFHFMGKPDEMRSLVVGNGEAVVSPSWSIHSGAGTRNYTFVWGMSKAMMDG